MEPFLVIGGVMFWLLLAAFSIIIVCCIEYEKGLIATVFTFLSFAAFVWLVDFNIFTWIVANPYPILIYVGGYFASGTVWAVVKWWFHCIRLREIVLRLKVKFNATTTNNQTFASYVVHNPLYTEDYYQPRASEHKSDWVRWAAYWPFSFVWTMINQPVKHTWLYIYSKLGGLMQMISNAVFKDM